MTSSGVNWTVEFLGSVSLPISLRFSLNMENEKNALCTCMHFPLFTEKGENEKMNEFNVATLRID